MKNSETSPSTTKDQKDQYDPDELEISSSMNTSDHSILSIITDQFVQEASNVPKRLYCPFCLFDFGFEFLLKNHIQEVHVQEIKNFSKTNLESFTMDQCSFCHAKFYVRGLLPKHVIRKHQESILNLTSEFNDNEHTAICNFCTYKVSLKQLKLFFIHLENKHLNKFSEVLCSYNLRINGMIPVSSTREEVPDNEQPNQIANFHISENVENERKILKPILKKGNLNSDQPETLTKENCPPKIRRKLRFDLPDSSFSSITSDKENLPLRNINKKVLGLKIKKGKRNLEKVKPLKREANNRTILKDITGVVHGSYNDIENGIEHLDISEKMPFKCGVCFEGFCSNSTLLNHMKKKHGKIHFHPRYRCGLCKAKFFRNSYLIRHNRSHNFSYKPL